ncbi:alpha/beta hydrolase [Hydrococcus rivularis]|uniref:alpha/beta hydrolase n=1 Tax=Hydrococcus rivularis TaxID=1616834 RepID=UPI0009FB255D|nr:alpha/beta hydrolase [Hydrococcus rivularis]
MKSWLGWRNDNESEFPEGAIAGDRTEPQKLFHSSIPLFGSIAALLFSLGYWIAPSAWAAERLSVRAGLFEHSVEVKSLEHLAKTGEVPSSLKSYKFLLTPTIKQAFTKSLYVDSALVEPLLADLFSSPDGEKLLDQLSKALPGTDAQRIKDTFSLALHGRDALNFLSFVRAYPDATLTVDLAEVAKIAVQLNASAWQNQMMSPRLERDLRVEANENVPLGIDPTVSGNEAVSMVTLRLKDGTRQRNIPVDIYYSSNTRGPLVVISHGFAADRKFLRYLARHLASYGMTVAALDHPGSNIAVLVKKALGMRVSQLLPASEFIDRPQDISFLLDKLEILNRRKGVLKGKLNVRQVTVIGHSYGGYTALAVAGAELNPKALRGFCQAVSILQRSPADWLQCAASELPYGRRQFRDPRVAQVIAFNPIIGNLFGNDLSGVKVPTLIVSSSADGITPTISHQLQPFKQLSGEKYLLVAIGATHMSLTDISNLNSTVGQSTLVQEVMGKDAESMRQMAKAIALAFVEQLTPAAPTYRPFLSPAYVQSLSDEKITFRLARELPPTVDAWLSVLNLGNRYADSDESEGKPSILKAIRGYFINATEMISPPAYCSGQLDRLFTGLLNTYDSDRYYWDSLA